jgi:hypothetical protein
MRETRAHSEHPETGGETGSAGEYFERGPLGGTVPKPRQVTIEPGDPKLPPTQAPGHTWERTGPPKP